MALLENFALINGISVTVSRPMANGKTAFNEEVEEYESESVENVLIAPSSTSDLDAARPYGERIVMTFHFPKTYTESLKDCFITYGNKTYKAIGDPQSYMSENTPSLWNRSVTAEVIDG